MHALVENYYRQLKAVEKTIRRIMLLQTSKKNFFQQYKIRKINNDNFHTVER